MAETQVCNLNIAEAALLPPGNPYTHFLAPLSFRSNGTTLGAVR